ncbi:S-adenosyl-L-methionine-dependent methyltransferase [Ephemerocybe angulata]|uniref:Protein-lysine N-methyltransferase EFM4 n=1 Tax=Ephemerocybe angulata TaxID=980116 RepID=A0A8H6HW98_9AGAR|nr:S-adenosyl-L-methionine-dependent methyltransferase [Tulosesus angulatus]
MSTAELNPSKLGTKEHWDGVYERELENFEEIGDEGEVWFGEDSVEKMVDWCIDNVPVSSNPAVLEIGSGNGTLLFGLLEAGYDSTRLAGIDYSAGAVKLAQGIAATKDGEAIAFTECDFLNDTPSPLPSDSSSDGLEYWDLLLDKGTYDAIALGDKDEEGRSPAAGYPSRIPRILKPGGLFLITSCNFTADELKASFTAETGLMYHSQVRHPTFTFGGQSGSIVTTVAFQKPQVA